MLDQFNFLRKSLERFFLLLSFRIFNHTKDTQIFRSFFTSSIFLILKNYNDRERRMEWNKLRKKNTSIYIRQEKFCNNDCCDETGLEFNYTETYTSFHPLFHPTDQFSGKVSVLGNKFSSAGWKA